MCQPRKWWWGLLPLVALFGLMMGLTRSPIESDLAVRSAGSFTASGLPWAKATISGRDAVVSGEAPNPESQKLALTAAERAWGVRRVTDATSVSADVKPYTVSATRDGGKITLTGFVPNDAARSSIVAAAKSAFPNAQVVDELKFGNGAPAVYGPAVAFGLAQLGKLTKGVASLSDSAFSIVGQAADFAGFDAVTAAVKQLPQGASLAKAEITAPAVSPYTFSATKADGALALSGYIPNEAARAPLIAAAKAAGDLKVTDALRVAPGLPAGLDLAKASEFVFAQLGRLKSGVASLRDDALSLSGQTDDVGVFESITNTLKGALPGGLKLASQDIKGPAPVSPYVWSATNTASGVTLAGSIPSESVRAPIVDAAKKAFPNRSIIDQMKVALGAPAGFADAVSASLGQLSKLTTGVATITDKAIRVTGEAASRTIADSLKAATPGLPASFGLTSQVTFKEPPPPPPAPVVAAAPAPAPAPPPAPAVAAPPPPPAPPVPLVVAPIPPPPSAPDLPAPVAPAAPPPPVAMAPKVPTAAEICQIKFREILNKDSIHFTTASARITAESQGVLRVLADAVKACPTMQIEIQGHTDADGGEEANLDLSNRRAVAVVRALEDLGVQPGRMTAKGYGKTQPIAANDTPEGKAKNRRIDFVVTR